MSISKELINYWAYLCESEEDISEAVRPVNPLSRVKNKTIDSISIETEMYNQAANYLIKLVRMRYNSIKTDGVDMNLMINGENYLDYQKSLSNSGRSDLHSALRSALLIGSLDDEYDNDYYDADDDYDAYEHDSRNDQYDGDVLESDDYWVKLLKQFKKQLKNKVKIKTRGMISIKPGKYNASLTYKYRKINLNIEIELTLSKEISAKVYLPGPHSDIHLDPQKRGEFSSPNLPNESEEI